MDDLISRLEIKKIFNEKCGQECGVCPYYEDQCELINIASTVEAVPLEPLCQWLAGYAAPPTYALDEVCDDSIDPESLVYTVNDRAKAWEYHFRELMKSGLMDTEGEDARP